MLSKLRHHFCRRLDQGIVYRSRWAGGRHRVVCYGNCQVQPVAQLLLANRSFRQRYRLICLPPVHEVQPHQSAQILEAVRQADVFIHQPVQDNYRKLGFAGSQFLCNQLPQGAIALAFPSLYFMGYSPEIIYIRRPDGQIFQGPAGDYHNRYILDGVLEQHSLQLMFDRLSALEGIAPALSQQIAEASFAELSRREQALPVQIVPWLRQHWQQQRLFWTANHPSRAVLEEVARQLLLKLGCDPLPQSQLARLQVALGDEPLGESSFPIHPSTYHNLGCQFPNPNRVSSGFRHRPLQTMVQAFYRYYAHNPEVLESYRLKLIH
jgi:hypothetical protein